MTEIIRKFMVSTSCLYANMDQKYLSDIIERCVKAGQYLYQTDCYVVLYWLIKQEDVQAVVNKEKIPDDISSGEIMYVAELAVKENASIFGMRKQVSGIPYRGLFWHRNNGVVIFPSQKGATI